MTGSLLHGKNTLGRLLQGVGRCRRGVAALEFGILAPTLLMLLFGFVATGTLIFTWSAMQNTSQYAALMVSTGQVKSMSTGAISTSNSTATTTCSGSLTTGEAEYYACQGLPSWATFTVTTTENCAVPSVSVSVSASGSTAAVADIFNIFTGRTLTAQSVVMKEGQCP